MSTSEHRITAHLYTCNAAQCVGTANVIRDNLAQIGIDVVIHSFPRFQQIAKEMTAGEPYDLFWEGWGADYPDASTFFDTVIKTGTPNNFAHYTSATTDARSTRPTRRRSPHATALWAALDRDLAAGDAPIAPALNGTARDLFSARMGCQVFNPVFGMDLARLCVGGPVSVTDFSIVADAPSAQAGAGVVTPSDIPVAAIPLQTLAQAAAPLHDVGLAGSPLHDVPLHDIGLGNTGGALSTVLLSQMPLLGRSWEQLLAGTTLANTPLQNVTFGQAQTVASAAVGSIRLGQIDLSASPLHDIGLAALALGATPLHDVPIHGASADPLVNWCAALAGPPVNCVVSTSLTNETVMSTALAGAPLHDIPLHDIPLHDINFAVSPLHDIPLHDVNVNGSPLHDVPLHDIVLGTPLHDVPLHDIPLHDVPLHDIPLHDIALIANVVNCALVSCANGTLGDALAANAILGTATLGDIAPNLTGYTLGDLGNAFGATTLGQLVPFLPNTFTFGELLIALIDPTTFAYEKLPFATMGVQGFATGGGVLGYTATFTLTGGAAVGTADVSATIPAGALYLPGTSKIQQLGGKAIFAPNPTVSGTLLTWRLKNVVVGRRYTLRFQTGTSLRLGPSQASAQVALVGQPGIPAPAPAAADITETFETGDDLASATTLQPNKVYFGYVSRANDADFYTFPAPPAGSRVTVRLSAATDDDLVVYSPAGAPQLRSSGIAGVPVQSPPIADEGVAPSASPRRSSRPRCRTSISAAPRSPASRRTAARCPSPCRRRRPGRGRTRCRSRATTARRATCRTRSASRSIRRSRRRPCSPRTFPFAGQGTAGAIPAGYNPNLNTIFLVDAKRIGDTYGAASEQSVLSALNTLAGRTDLGVSGAVVPVEGNAAVQTAYTAWDANPCNPALANDVVTGIGSVIDSIRAARPTLKYVVMVGADDIVPMARVPDNTQIANERGYSSMFAGGANNEYYGSLYARTLLSDQPYADIDPIALLDRQIYVPDLSLGRLVETPQQIVAAATRFQTFGGVLNPTTT